MAGWASHLISDSVALGWKWRIYISKKFLLDAEAACLGTTDVGNEESQWSSAVATRSVLGRGGCWATPSDAHSVGLTGTLHQHVCKALQVNLMQSQGRGTLRTSPCLWPVSIWAVQQKVNGGRTSEASCVFAAGPGIPSYDQVCIGHRKV